MWIYFFTALISLGCVVYYFETTLNKVNQKQLMILIFTALSNISYFCAVTSNTLEAYLTSYVFYYIGNMLSMMMMVLLIGEICGFKDNKYLRRGLFLYGLFLIFLVISIDKSDLYYVSYEFVREGNLAFLRKVYGPLHSLLLILIFGTNILCMVFTIIAFVKKRAFSTRIAGILLLILFTSAIVYILPKIFHLKQDGLPIAFTVMDIMFIMIFKRASMYDMSDNLLRVYEQRSEYGYIALDKKYRYVGASEFALKLFPELKNIRIDSKIEKYIDNCECALCHNLMPWVYQWDEIHHQNYVYTKDDVTAACSIKDIKYNGKKVGFLIEMRDVSKQQKYIDLINTYNTQLETKVQEKTKKVQEIQDSIISGMAAMVESRDNSTGGHIRRTSEGVKIFVEQLMKPENNKWHFTESFCKNLIKAAPMHDLGKIAVDDVILRKPGKFEPHEYEQMKKHSAEGARIVRQVLSNVDDAEFVQIAVNVAHYHHEKWNGNGYPEGLKEKEIPIEARIMAFADVFDALVSKRCYKDSFTFDKAFEIIKNDLGNHFDPELGPVFLQCREKLENFYSSLNSEGK